MCHVDTGEKKETLFQKQTQTVLIVWVNKCLWSSSVETAGFKFFICYRYIMKAKSETYNYKVIETMT